MSGKNILLTAAVLIITILLVKSFFDEKEKAALRKQVPNLRRVSCKGPCDPQTSAGSPARDPAALGPQAPLPRIRGPVAHRLQAFAVSHEVDPVPCVGRAQCGALGWGAVRGWLAWRYLPSLPNASQGRNVKQRRSARSLADYDRNFLKQQFLAALGRSWVEREEAIYRWVRWMGYGRTTDGMFEIGRSLINGLVRTGELEVPLRSARGDGRERIRRA